MTVADVGLSEFITPAVAETLPLTVRATLDVRMSLMVNPAISMAVASVSPMVSFSIFQFLERSTDPSDIIRLLLLSERE